MGNKERVLYIVAELEKLRARQSALQLELDSLIVPDAKTGRPPRGEISLSDEIMQLLKEASGPVSTPELRAKTGAPPKHVSAALSYMLKKGVIERPEKGTYSLKTA